MRTPSKGLRVGAAATATAAAGTLFALAILPGSAGAAFDPSFNTQCANVASIQGRGASFQRTAQLAWGASSDPTTPAAATNKGFGYAAFGDGGCSAFKLDADGGKNTVKFDPQGSGEGRGVMGATTSTDTNAGAPKGVPGVRKTELQFAAADEPPKEAEIRAANMGPDGLAGTGDDAVLYTLPVAQSSVAVAVQLPTGCTVPVSTNANARRITRNALEGAFAAAADYTTWGQILPGIVGTDAAGTTTCKAKAFKRVVRLDSSGTTYALKNYLRDIKAADFPISQTNQTWPNESTSPVVRGDINGGGSLMDKLKAQTTDGGISYADLATARAKGFDIDASSVAAGDADTSIWLSVERKGGAAYESPALTTDNGANCKNVTYADVNTGGLPSVKSSWYDVSGSSSAADYPICALTYELVWEDMSKANVGRVSGSPEYTQGQARSVKDYLGYILNVGVNGGQAALAPAGYQGLPTVASGAAQAGSVLAVAKAGQAALTWNKQTVVDPGTGGGGTGTTPVATTPVATTPVATTPVPTTPAPTTPVKTTPAPAPKPAAKPKVSVSKAAAVKGRKITLTVSPSAAGRVTVSATTGTGKKKVTVLTGSATAKKSGALKITLKPTSKGKKALKSGKSVKVSFKVTYTNADGSKTTVTKSIKVKIKG